MEVLRGRKRNKDGGLKQEADGRARAIPITGRQQLLRTCGKNIYRYQRNDQIDRQSKIKYDSYRGYEQKVRMILQYQKAEATGLNISASCSDRSLSRNSVFEELSERVLEVRDLR
jgi:hypothetical protein